VTVIVGLLGAECVALAADGYATGGSGPNTTGSAAMKIEVLHGRIACGFAGTAGLKQRVLPLLTEGLTPGQCGQPISALRPAIRGIVNSVQREAAAEQVDGKDPIMLAALFVGVSDDGSPWIYEIADSGADEEHSLFEAIGSGRVYAQCSLSMNRHYGVVGPKQDIAMLFVYRAVADAIVIGRHRGIGPPIKVAIATRRGVEVLDAKHLERLQYQMEALQIEEREMFRRLADDRGFLAPDVLAEVEPSTGIEPPSDRV
jgi:20S proteasome alpha/beta subunit